MLEDAELLRQFEDRTLPFDLWTHRAHVKVAYLYLRKFSFPEALDRMRCGIQAYNAANQRPDGLTSGYHETLTHAFMHLILATVAAHGAAETADQFCDEQPQLLQKKILRLFYSKARIVTLEAKAAFVEPDLTPLPRIAPADACGQSASCVDRSA